MESRSRTLFENKFDDAIQLCAMSPNGPLAVFTKSKLYVYDPMFEKIYIVDSLGASSGYGLLMDRLADLRDKGEDVDSVYEWALANRLRPVSYTHLLRIWKKT